MSTCRRIGATVVVAVLLSGSARGDDAANAFADAQRIIEANHPEKVDATPQGMLSGAVRLEEAIALGFRDRYRAYQLLGYAYSQVAYGVPPGPRRAEYLRRSREAYRGALAARPDDLEALRGLTRVQPDYASSVGAFRALLRVAPDDPEALFQLGRKLVGGEPSRRGERSTVRDAEIDEGVAMLKRAATNTRGHGAPERRAEIAQLLKSQGRVEDAAEVERLSPPAR